MKRDGGEDLSLHEITVEFGCKLYVIPCMYFDLLCEDRGKNILLK